MFAKHGMEDPRGGTGRLGKVETCDAAPRRWRRRRQHANTPHAAAWSAAEGGGGSRLLGRWSQAAARGDGVVVVVVGVVSEVDIFMVAGSRSVGRVWGLECGKVSLGGTQERPVTALPVSCPECACMQYVPTLVFYSSSPFKYDDMALCVFCMCGHINTTSPHPFHVPLTTEARLPLQVSSSTSSVQRLKRQGASGRAHSFALNSAQLTVDEGGVSAGALWATDSIYSIAFACEHPLFYPPQPSLLSHQLVSSRARTGER